LGAVLIERTPRLAFLQGVNASTDAPVVAVPATGIHVLADLVSSLVADEAFLRFVGSELLLNLEPSPQGGYRVPDMSLVTAEDHRRRGANARESKDPWDLLLQAAVEPSQTAAFLAAVRERGETKPEWLRQAFADSLTHWLRGWRESDAHTWTRGWTP